MNNREFYTRLRDYSTRTINEINRFQRDSESIRNRTRNQYRDAIARLDADGKARLDKVEKAVQTDIDNIQKTLDSLSDILGEMDFIVNTNGWKLGNPPDPYVVDDENRIKEYMDRIKDSYDLFCRIQTPTVTSRLMRKKEITDIYYDVRFYCESVIRTMNKLENDARSSYNNAIRSLKNDVGQNKALAERNRISAEKTDSARIAQMESDLRRNVASLANRSFPSEYVTLLQRQNKSLLPRMAGIPIGLRFGHTGVDLSRYGKDPILVDAVRTRLRELSVEGGIALPQTIRIPGIAGIYVGASEKDLSHASELLNSITVYALTQCEPGNVRVYSIDCSGKGRNMGVLLRINAVDPSSKIFGKVATDGNGIKDVLDTVEGEISDIILNRFNGHCSNFMEYNKTGSKPIPLRVLNIYDYPHSFTPENAKRLKDLLSNSGGMGLIVNIVSLGDAGPNGYDRLPEVSDLFDNSYVCRQGSFTDQYGGKLTFPRMAERDVDRFAAEYARREAANSAKKKAKRFFDYVPNVFNGDASAGLHIPLGTDDDENVVFADLAGSSSHGLIFGKTGGGKSTLLHTIILQAMMAYSPDELNLYLMDFKGGVEFKSYSRKDLPHVKMVSIGNVPEFGETVFGEIKGEIERRMDAFSEVEATSLGEYREKTGMKMPRVLAIVDEFHLLFSDNTGNMRIASACATYAEFIVQEGRAFGVHLLMATQDPKYAIMNTTAKSALSQMQFRVALNLNETECGYIMDSKDAKIAFELQRTMERPTIYKVSDMSEPRKLYTAFGDKETRSTAMVLIASNSKKWKSDIRIFDINETHPIPLDVGSRQNNQTIIKLGTPMSNDDYAGLCLTDNSSNNTWIVGSGELSKNLEEIIIRAVGRLNGYHMFILEPPMGNDGKRMVPRNCACYNNVQDHIRILLKINQIMKDGGPEGHVILMISDLNRHEFIQQLLDGDRLTPSDFGLDTDDDPRLSDCLESIYTKGGLKNITTILTMEDYTELGSLLRSFERYTKNKIVSNVDSETVTTLMNKKIAIDGRLACIASRGDVRLFKPFAIR